LLLRVEEFWDIPGYMDPITAQTVPYYGRIFHYRYYSR